MPAHARAFVDALVAKFAGKECQVLEQKTKQIKARSREKAPLERPRQVSPAEFPDAFANGIPGRPCSYLSAGTVTRASRLWPPSR